MRGKRAKALRKQAYGDRSLRERAYEVRNQSVKQGNAIQVKGDTVVAVGPRRVYQALKKAARSC